MSLKTRLMLALGGCAMAAGVTACDDEATPPVDTTCEAGAGVICTYMGTGIAGLTADGLHALQTDMYLPQDLTFGPDDQPYVLDWNNHRIRTVANDAVSTIVGTGMLGDAQDGYGGDINLNHPTHIAFAPNGDMIIAAWHNSKILRYNFDTQQVTTICGDGRRAFGGDGGPANLALLDLPVATAFAPTGEMYITDQANQRIRLVDADDNINTIAGNGTPGFAGDGGPAAAAQISLPVGQSAPPAGRIAVDADGTLFLADTVNNRIRFIDTEGNIETLAGNGTAGFAGDGGNATEAELNSPADVAIDADGNVYVADTQNSCVRMINGDGVISTFAGMCGEFGYAGDGGAANAATLNRPYGIAFDAQGNIYIADTHNHRIRVVYR